MSCRVLGRRVQEAALAHLAAAAASEGAKSLIGRYIPSAKNRMVAGHYRIAWLHTHRQRERTGRPNGASTWRAMRRQIFRCGSKTEPLRAQRSTLERPGRARPFGDTRDFVPACCLIRSSLSLRSCRFRSCSPIAPEPGVETAAKVALVCMSFVFYAWWRPSQLPLLLISIAFNYVAGEWMQRARAADHPEQVRAILVVGVLADVLFLGWFKYANFVVDNINWVTGSNIHLDRIALPLAISFFTFQKIAYLIDTARGETCPGQILDFSCSPRSIHN